jgi:hypothetical protein
MTEWHMAFGSVPTTVRDAVDVAQKNNTDLLDAMREFPIEERGEINRAKLGWVLRKHANRIVDDYEFQQAPAQGRTGWRVVAVDPPPLPPLPPLSAPVAKTVTQTNVSGEKDTGQPELINNAPLKINPGGFTTVFGPCADHCSAVDALDQPCCSPVTHPKTPEQPGKAGPSESDAPISAQPTCPITIEEENEILAWLASIGETEPEDVATVLNKCCRDPGARDYFLKHARGEI